MSQVELSYLTCITNSSEHVLVIASVTHTCHKLNDLALSHRSLIRFLVNVLVFWPDHLFITPFKHESAAIHYISVSVFFLRVRCSYKHKCGRYRNALRINMRVVIMHAQPSSGSMHLIFGPYVRPNGACLSRLLHIVDNIICLC